MGKLKANLLFFLSLVSLFLKRLIAVNTMTSARSIDDSQTIVSAGHKFELGFFNGGNSNNRYLGIWYKNLPVRTVVWVANREFPLVNSSGLLTLGDDGTLSVVNESKSIIWSSNSSLTAKDPVAVLLDTGNFIVKDAGDDNEGRYIWQSFDYPSDTLLPGMKLGWNKKTGLNRHLTSWKSSDDPSPGEYTYTVDPRGLPQLVLRKGSSKLFRSGPWYGTQFSGVPVLKVNPVFTPIFVSTADEVYYSYNTTANIPSRFVLSQSGSVQHLSWNDRHSDWYLIFTVQQDRCDNYGLCGSYDLIDIRKVPEYGQDLYIRMASSALERHADTSNNRKNVTIATTISVASAMIILALIGWFVNWKKKMIRDHQPENQVTISKVESEDDLELPSVEFATIQVATNNFSAANKIGEGGFGPVYKGELQSGQEVAVKRLAENSGQGLQEFKNEVLLISKLQHRNLVKLLDFGMARMFRGDQTEANTKRIVGTYGYMPPEYAIDGHFSLKSDVFSFGVILLEMVSGKKNRGFFHSTHKLNLLGHAWKLWNEEKALELVDELMEQDFPEEEALRCIQVGLLCVQQRPEDRPVMQTVVLMLDSESMPLPQPGRPGFYAERCLSETDSSSIRNLISNEMTVTLIEGR
ncbi:hypothetical protein V6N12_040215 [Hibiscus sabdariffa]|uniref:Receptor-like serine/threonine-protein kinase n=1 Tax=Hibiscus sabdariffa TaxID=183260 RepID=A0ABR2E336_9ROSI